MHFHGNDYFKTQQWKGEYDLGDYALRITRKTITVANTIFLLGVDTHHLFQYFVVCTDLLLLFFWFSNMYILCNVGLKYN